MIKDESLLVIKLPRMFEAFIEIIIKLIGLYFTYLVFKKMGISLMGKEFQTDTLFSLLLLPVLYIFKDSHVVFKPFTIKVLLNDKDVTVTSGFFTKRHDKLTIRTVDNIELITTPIGRLYNYGTLHLYTPGATVTLPYIKNAIEIQVRIENIMKVQNGN
ncbi:PH domain-containing protein [Colwellia piezophila]|uniref:PH domain-containing protein n=1 Tax=Colwellia piezophila TaxID=211668 RepID=UPI00146C9665|nr:PH domain-containing protein [Colwellia piezophila]